MEYPAPAFISGGKKPRCRGDGNEHSYVTHTAVQKYLKDYAGRFDLQRCIKFGCHVDHLKVLHNTDSTIEKKDDLDIESWPRISLTWTDSKKGCARVEEFDGICVANGHYAMPSF